MVDKSSNKDYTQIIETLSQSAKDNFIATEEIVKVCKNLLGRVLLYSELKKQGYSFNEDAEVISALSKKEYEIIKFRYGLDDGQTKNLEEASKKFGVTRERIRQIETKAFDKLSSKNN